MSVADSTVWLYFDANSRTVIYIVLVDPQFILSSGVVKFTPLPPWTRMQVFRLLEFFCTNIQPFCLYVKYLQIGVLSIRDSLSEVDIKN